ncbi:hypothetical protein FRC11_000449 [Ceratobasidium sp. 423]|nr:hypothetical protein FRC11_000449 [Ceratobasidium sp. 423]
MLTQSTQSTKQLMFIELPAEANSTDCAPFYVIQAGLVTGIYPESAWSEISHLLHAKLAGVTCPWWRKCKSWNQAVYAVTNRNLLHVSQFEGDKLMPQPPHHVMAAEYWHGLWRTPAMIILEHEDADHVCPWVGCPIQNPTMQFVIRSSANLGRPLFTTHRMNAAPLLPPSPLSHDIKSKEAAILLSTHQTGAKWQKGPSGHLNILPKSHSSLPPLQPPLQPLFHTSSSQALSQPMHETWSQLDTMSVVEAVRLIPSSSVADAPTPSSPLAPAPPSTLAGDLDGQSEDQTAPVSEWSFRHLTCHTRVSLARMSMSSPSLGDHSPEHFPVDVNPPLAIVIDQSDACLRALSRMRTQDLSFEVEVNARLIIQALDGWFFTWEGADAIRAAVVNLN